MRRADRLMKMTHFLRQRRRAVTAERIGEEFDICTRTVYRDIQALMDSGVPIRGEAGVGYVIDKAYYLPPLAFDADELEALTLGISMVRHWTDDAFADKASAALDKIQAVLPAELQGEFDQITTYSTASTPIPPVPWQCSFSELRDGIRKRQTLTLDYQDGKRRSTTRTVRPLALIFASPVWMLAGWCETRRAFRHFRLDRIQNCHFSPDAYPDDKDKNLDAYLAYESSCLPA